jgi:hypothetical protein
MNIIGDQLITDKKVAVIEIIKNSYDADAENVSVRFFNLKNYGSTYLTDTRQKLIIIDIDTTVLVNELGLSGVMLT